ncbi:MAG: gliding motility lipoprotein GldB [Bacteroidetes bacterium]|nr:gliding motility lipoprotein GldB [Bacteroidota bacterium]
MKILTHCLLIFIVLFAMGCSRKAENCVFQPDTGNIKVGLSFESLEDSLPAIKTKSQLAGFFARHPDIRDLFFNRGAYPGDSTFINRLYNRFTNPHIDTLLLETHRVFGNGTELKEQFERAFANVRYYYPAFTIPKIKTIISGLETDLYVSDTLIIVGLDYFLGAGARYKPNTYEYIQRRYTKDFIVPSVMLLTGIDSRINRINPDDKTTLAEIIAYGKAYYFTKHMIPCAQDTLLIGYSGREMRGSEKYEYLIWSRFVEDQVLFSTSHLVKQKFIAERPKTIEVGEECPGRIGTWVGWRIINTYMENHPETTLQQMMLMDNASKIFNASGYRPQVVKVPGKTKD